MTEHRIGLTEGLLIAGVPAAGYWFAFLYELGYCKYFDIPPEFIEIGVLNVLVAIVGLGSFMGLVHVYANFLHTLSSLFPKVVRSSLFRVIIILALVSGFALVLRLTQQQHIGLIVLIVVPHAFLEFVFPLITQRKIAGYVNKLEAQERLELQRETIMDLVAKSIGRNAFIFLLLLLAFSFTAFFAGGYEAKKQRDFMVIEEAPDKLIVKRNGAYFLVAQFDRKEKSISRNFSLTSANRELGFRYERVGPLLPEGLEIPNK